MYRPVVKELRRAAVPSLLGISGAKLFTSSINRIAESFETWEKDEKLPEECLQDTYNDAKGALEFLDSWYVEQEITQALIEFVLKYLLLVQNWCVNAKSESLIGTIKRISAMYRGSYTLMEQIKLLQYLQSRIKKQMRYSMPSIELAKHYLLQLDKVRKDGPDTK